MQSEIIDFNNNILDISNGQDLVDSLREEEAAFQEALCKMNNGTEPKDDIGHQLVRHVAQYYSQLISQLKNTKSSNDRAIKIKETLTQYADTHKLLRHNDPEVLYAIELAKTEQKTAFLMLGYYWGVDFNYQSPEGMRAIVLATNFDYNIASKLNYDYESMMEHQNSWKKNINKQRKELLSIKSDTELSISQFVESSERLYEELHTRMSTTEDKLSDLWDSSEKKMKGIQQSYTDEMATKSSVTYWSEKARQHKIHAYILGPVSAALAILMIILMGIGLYKALSLETVAYWQMAIVAVMASLAIWIIRVLVRIFLSKLHLAEDAEERVTMVKTYLALLTEKDGITGINKELILSALFRPSSVGLIKDEAPATPMDIALKVVDRATTK